MRIKGLLIVLITGFASCLVYGQETKKMAAFATILDFQNGNIEDSVTVEIMPIENTFTPDFCKPYPKGTDYYYSFLARKVAILSDGKDLLLNINQFRILNGFVRLGNSKKYNWFQSRMIKPESDPGMAAAFGLLGAAISEIEKEARTRESVTYLFTKGQLGLQILNAKTLTRLLEPFPEMYFAYTTDPTKEDLETMITYLEILEEFEQNESN